MGREGPEGLLNDIDALDKLDERTDIEALEEELDGEGQWELDPNDPSHPDYDLSIAAGYADWQPAPKPWFLRRGVILGVTLLIVAALMAPLFLRLLFPP